MKIHYTKICPNCGTIPQIRTDFIQILAPTPEKCRKCSYSGLFPEIDINEIEEFRINLKSQ